MLIEVPASKAATTELQIKEDKEMVKEIFTEIWLPNDADSMVSLTRFKPNPSRTTTNPPPLKMALIDFSYGFSSVENVLTAAKTFKGSVKFTEEIVQLKHLIATRNDLNKRLKKAMEQLFNMV